jgi:hypothetical protein
LRAPSSRTPGNGRTEAEESQQQDEDYDGEHSDDPHAIASEAALLQGKFALVGAKRLWGVGHKQILRDRPAGESN